MTKHSVECDHACSIHKPAKITTEIWGAVDTSERGRRRARRRMSPETRKIWDELSASVDEFHKAARERMKT